MTQYLDATRPPAQGEVTTRALVIKLVTRKLTYLLIVREHARGGSMELTLDREVIEAYLWQQFAMLLGSHTRLVRSSPLGFLHRETRPQNVIESLNVSYYYCHHCAQTKAAAIALE